MRLVLRLTNGGDATLALDAVEVSVRGGTLLAPAPRTTGSGTGPFRGALAPDRSATGTYVHALVTTPDDSLEVTVNAGTGGPDVVLRGEAP